MAIQRANPGIQLSDDDQKRAIQGTLMQVGVGAVIANGPLTNGSIAGTVSSGASQPKGCVSYLRFQKSAEDLTIVIVDGNTYSGGNINEFREVLLDASLAMKCVSFCWDSEKREMTMLNVHPLCCCRCEEFGNG
jgi:hypothetical protein